MSTATFKSLTASPTPSVSSSGGQSNMQRGANYFFGFLITFIILLLAFIACGIGSRRRAARRRNFITGLDPWLGPESIQPLEQPKLWEPYIVRGSDDDWSTLMPLSVSRHLNSIGAGMQPNTQEHDNTRHSLTSSLDDSLASMRLPWQLSLRGSDVVDSIKPKVSQSLLVAVIIAMPSSRKQPAQEKEDDILPEYQIGVAHVQDSMPPI